MGVITGMGKGGIYCFFCFDQRGELVLFINWLMVESLEFNHSPLCYQTYSYPELAL
jgi:hypothetical protein